MLHIFLAPPALARHVTKGREKSSTSERAGAVTDTEQTPAPHTHTVSWLDTRSGAAAPPYLNKLSLRPAGNAVEGGRRWLGTSALRRPGSKQERSVTSHCHIQLQLRPHARKCLNIHRSITNKAPPKVPGEHLKASFTTPQGVACDGALTNLKRVAGCDSSGSKRGDVKDTMPCEGCTRRACDSRPTEFTENAPVGMRPVCGRLGFVRVLPLPIFAAVLGLDSRVHLQIRGVRT